MTFDLGSELNTFTIIGRCPRSHQLGVALATYSLAVGGYCPFVKANLAALSTQAFANPQLGLFAMRLLDMGYSPAKVIQELEGHDPHIEYRQVGIVYKDGTAVAKTGKKTRDWAGHITGDGFVAMGNVLVGEHVVQAMARAFEETLDQDLALRLLAAVEAGRDSGGQLDLEERSSALIVYDREDYALTDLRVDAHDDPVEELRRIYDLYKHYIPLYDIRAKQPDKYPPQQEWTKQLQEKGLISDG